MHAALDTGAIHPRLPIIINLIIIVVLLIERNLEIVVCQSGH
jgi:hypothetical protein